MPTPTKNINAEKIQGNLTLDTISATTISAATYYNAPVTTGVTISNGVVAFNRVDSQSAYTVTYSGVNLSVVSDNINKVVTFSATTGPQTDIIYVDSTYGVDIIGNGDILDPFRTVEYALSSTTNTALFTGGTTSGSTSISGISDTHNAQLKVGQYVTGSGIPFDTIIVAKGNQGLNVNTITISRAATSTVSNSSLTWWSVKRVKLIGDFTATSNWFKLGYWIDTQNCNYKWGGFTLYNIGSTAIPIPHYILGEGNGYGFSSSSQYLYSIVASANANYLSIEFGTITSLGTGYFMTFGDGNGSPRNVIINGKNINALFGGVMYMGVGFNYNNLTYLTFNCDAYGLTYGINGGGYIGTIINGNITTPTSVFAISSYGIFTGRVIGKVSFSGLFNGSINGTAHSLSGTLNSNGVSGAITVSNSLTSNYNGPGFGVSVTGFFVNNGNVWDTAVTVSAGGTIINNGSLTTGSGGSDFTVNGKLINNGRITFGSYNPTGVNVGATGVLINNGDIISNINSNGNGFLIENNGDIYPTGTINLAHTGKFINKGKISNTSYNMNLITVNSYSAECINYGLIENNNTSTTYGLITKTKGIVRLMPGTYLKPSNNRNPIIIPIVDSGTTTSLATNKLIQTGQNFLTSVPNGAKVKNVTTSVIANVISADTNTQLSLDADIITATGQTFYVYGNPNVYIFNAITNCDGTSNGLGFPFDSVSYTPNDLVGGTKYENINY